MMKKAIAAGFNSAIKVDRDPAAEENATYGEVLSRECQNDLCDSILSLLRRTSLYSSSISLRVLIERFPSDGGS